MFGKVHCGSLSNKKIKSRGKTNTYATNSFKKIVNDVLNREQRNRAHFFTNYSGSYG